MTDDRTIIETLAKAKAAGHFVQSGFDAEVGRLIEIARRTAGATTDRGNLEDRPYAYMIGGNDGADMDGFFEVRIDRGGEFNVPLYTRPAEPPRSVQAHGRVGARKHVETSGGGEGKRV